jgi:hypothetical protein
MSARITPPCRAPPSGDLKPLKLRVVQIQRLIIACPAVRCPCPERRCLGPCLEHGSTISDGVEGVERMILSFGTTAPCLGEPDQIVIFGRRSLPVLICQDDNAKSEIAAVQLLS